MRRLLIVINDDSFFFSHFLPLALEAKNSGFDVHVACPVGRYESRFIEQGLSFHPVAFDRSGRNILKELIVLISLFRLFKNLSPDLLHLFTIKPVIYGGIVRRLLSIKAQVSTITGLGFVFISKGFVSKLRRRLAIAFYKLALNNRNSRVIFENNDDRSLFENIILTKKNITTVVKGAGVDLTIFKPDSSSIIGNASKSSGKLSVVLPARMLIDKGVVEFVDAARLLKELGTPLTFVLAGGVDESNPTGISENQLREWGNSGLVNWLGFQEDMTTIYQDADIVCLPSYRDGMPKSLLEAMACGKPVVTTDVPGCREAIIDGVNGYLVSVKSSKDLADKLLKLVKNDKVRNEFGKASRKMAEETMDVRKITKTIVKQYNQLL